MNPFELQKQRVLVFADEPAHQIEQAFLLLSGLDDLQVENGPISNSLLIRYSVEHYSLEGLEKALLKEGFTFNYGWLSKLKNGFIHYCEDVQYHNLKSPEPRTKNNTQEVFIKAYDHHPHGDHDYTKAPASHQSK
ncbi:MAG: hypothetical protein WCT35_00770 [Sideroxydans sp.]|jgi:hypothetical protein